MVPVFIVARGHDDWLDRINAMFGSSVRIIITVATPMCSRLDLSPSPQRGLDVP
jgi:hypothetical protein